MALFSCGKSAEEEVKDAIETANIHLNKWECQEAIDNTANPNDNTGLNALQNYFALVFEILFT